jgi:hypothetical protein
MTNATRREALAWRFHESPTVTMRITVAPGDRTNTLRVDGELLGDDVAELLRVCEEQQGPKTLDLAGVRFVDVRGVSALHDLRARGAAILGASPYVRLLLGQPATEDDAS